jgi:8-oxo-dGTP diphosphatase
MAYRNPTPTVDIIIELDDRIVLIERLNEPYGWALPGGFVDYGETVETAAIREAAEETSLEIRLLEQFYVYSDPQRDPRQHTLSVVFIAQASGAPVAQDDAKGVGLFDLTALPTPLCFDHQQILEDYRQYRRTGQRPNVGS